MDDDGSNGSNGNNGNSKQHPLGKPKRPWLGAGPGRPKGSSNKPKWLINQAVLNACDNAGGEGGAEAYLTWAARKYPTAFLALLGKTMALQVSGDNTSGRRIVVEIVRAEYAAPADKPKLIDAAVVEADGTRRDGGG
jgi:hypothetical protein